MIDIESSPNLLPRGYRVVIQYHWRPVEIGGRRRRGNIRIIQRQETVPGFHTVKRWENIGFWDEVMPTLKPQPDGMVRCWSE